VNQQISVVKDSVSASHGTSGTGTDYCGNRVYSISSIKNSASADLTFSELTIGSSTGLISLYTANSATVGTHTATVTVSLSSYPTATITSS